MNEKLSRAVNQTAELFKVCGDATRANIICELREGECSVSELADRLGMTVSAVSHQLRILKSTRIVGSRREGKSVLYALESAHIRQVFDLTLQHVMGGESHEMD